jgi:NAD(P) transhydrogenase subunit alpha
VSLNISIVKEKAAHERRVAATPETVKKLIAAGASVFIEKGAGVEAACPDSHYEQAGARLVDREDALRQADILAGVQIAADDFKALKEGAVVIGLMNPYRNKPMVAAAEERHLVTLAMDLVPRITRAQSMDVLSSQANLAGYKAVLDATEHYGRALPMMMTAAGTISPAKIFVMGAGVAGLQAIATARRLGAVVSATDVRPAAKEQVKSLGASFVAVEDAEFKSAETAGGYAKEMSAEYKAKQAALVEDHIAKQDIVITTALIPGRPAPRLITQKMVESMKPGSVIVDMAVDSGGNCDVSKNGEIIVHHGVSVVGHTNIPSRVAADASALYARNVFNLLQLLIDKDKKELSIPWGDDIVKGVLLTKDGHIVHPNFTFKEEKL